MVPAVLEVQRREVRKRPAVTTRASTIISQIHPSMDPSGTAAWGSGWISARSGTPTGFPERVKLPVPPL
jgi:hypothetical protein